MPAQAAPPAVERPGGPTVVHGFLRAPDGDPLAGATVTLISRGGRQLDRVSSLADGSYIVSVPEPGAYVLVVTDRQLAPLARHITVGEQLVYDVELPDEVDATP